MCTCVGPPDVIVKGSFTVLIGGMPAARIGDMTAHGGVIVMGQPNVIIGECRQRFGLFRRRSPGAGEGTGCLPTPRLSRLPRNRPKRWSRRPRTAAPFAEICS